MSLTSLQSLGLADAPGLVCDIDDPDCVPTRPTIAPVAVSTVEGDA